MSALPVIQVHPKSPGRGHARSKPVSFPRLCSRKGRLYKDILTKRPVFLILSLTILVSKAFDRICRKTSL